MHAIPLSTKILYVTLYGFDSITVKKKPEELPQDAIYFETIGPEAQAPESNTETGRAKIQPVYPGYNQPRISAEIILYVPRQIRVKNIFTISIEGAMSVMKDDDADAIIEFKSYGRTFALSIKQEKVPHPDDVEIFNQATDAILSRDHSVDK